MSTTATTRPRDVLLVSHANPEDNEFARWLTLKLAGLGYHAWSDVTRLLGGEDFWRDIEHAIRHDTVKLLYVLSRSSNQKDGPLRELKVADDVRRKEDFQDFIIPLHIDDLPFTEFNIQLANLNAIDFSQGWAPGLRQLVAKLERDGVPKSAAFGPGAVRQWWENAYHADEGTSLAEEVHFSNWFRVELPPTIYKHTLIGLADPEPAFPFPAKFRNGLVTFASAADLVPHLGTLRVQASVAVPTREFLFDDDRRIQRDNRDMITSFLNEAWKLAAASRLAAYGMSGGRIAFYFDTKSLPEPDVKFIGIRGKPSHRGLMGYKTTGAGRRHWHFAVSAKAAVHPEPLLMVRSHVLFSDDGVRLWESPAQMHRARRSQCKSWWNDDWRDRLVAAMSWLASGQPSLALPLAGSDGGSVSVRPIEFTSPLALDEEADGEQSEAEDLGGDDDGDEEDVLEPDA